MPCGSGEKRRCATERGVVVTGVDRGRGWEVEVDASGLMARSRHRVMDEFRLGLIQSSASARLPHPAVPSAELAAGTLSNPHSCPKLDFS